MVEKSVPTKPRSCCEGGSYETSRHFSMQRACGGTFRACLIANSRPSTQVHRLHRQVTQRRSLQLQVRAAYLDSSAATLNVNKYSMAAEDYTTVNNPTATLNNDLKIPLVGLGTWRGEEGQVEKAVEMALKAGYRYYVARYCRCYGRSCGGVVACEST